MKKALPDSLMPFGDSLANSQQTRSQQIGFVEARFNTPQQQGSRLFHISIIILLLCLAREEKSICCDWRIDAGALKSQTLNSATRSSKDLIPRKESHKDPWLMARRISGESAT